uniref:Uncharacterized protein n=1 Tax=Glossina austeni TaxID=7395 RepID=A0A1A9UFA0_GLOAU
MPDKQIRLRRSTVAGTNVLSSSIPLTLVMLPAFIIAHKLPGNMFVAHVFSYFIDFGLVPAQVFNKLVIAYITIVQRE